MWGALAPLQSPEARIDTGRFPGLVEYGVAASGNDAEAQSRLFLLSHMATVDRLTNGR